MAKLPPKSKTVTPARSESGDLERLEKILDMMERYQVADLEWEKGAERLRLRTQSAVSAGAVPQVIHHSAPALGYSPPPVQAPSSGATAAHAAPSGASAGATVSANQKQVTSPFVGTFYRSASPSSAPYVQEGKAVKRGDVLCIIEAMKLMNEIDAEFPGKVVSILVENGQPVEFGEPLFVIEV